MLSYPKSNKVHGFLIGLLSAFRELWANPNTGSIGPNLAEHSFEFSEQNKNINKGWWHWETNWIIFQTFKSFKQTVCIF